MASLSTFNAVYNIPGPNTAAAVVVADYHPLGGGTTGFTQQTVQTGTTRLVLGVPPNSAFMPGTPFEVRAIGMGVTAAADNMTVAIWWQSGANTDLSTTTGDVVVVSSGTQALASKGGYVAVQQRLMWDDTNKQLMGIGDFGMSSIPTTPAAVLGAGLGTINGTNPIAVSSTAAQAAIATMGGLQFYVIVTNSAAVTSTALIEFSLNQF